MGKLVQGVNDLYTWCMENGDFGQQLLLEFGDGNNSQQFMNEHGMYMTPHDFSRATPKKIKWTCKNGHVWDAKISSRTYNRLNCPYCSHTYRRSPGATNLLAWCQNNGEWGQQLLFEFGDGNNTQQFLDENRIIMTPLDYTKASPQKIKWTCKYNHKWDAQISNRTLNKSKCPYCSGQDNSEAIKNGKLKQGVNDLYTWCLNNGDFGQSLIDE